MRAFAPYLFQFSWSKLLFSILEQGLEQFTPPLRCAVDTVKVAEMSTSGDTSGVVVKSEIYGGPSDIATLLRLAWLVGFAEHFLRWYALKCISYTLKLETLALSASSFVLRASTRNLE